ncbi:hypothetical protein G6F57_016581 [Rhizopus arrhizus]|nr:hypothetical protein G6F57_016581 [Rhizopus arrhizus]
MRFLHGDDRAAGQGLAALGGADGIPAGEDFLANAAALDGGVVNALPVVCREIDAIIALCQCALTNQDASQ